MIDYLYSVYLPEAKDRSVATENTWTEERDKSNDAILKETGEEGKRGARHEASGG